MLKKEKGRRDSARMQTSTDAGARRPPRYGWRRYATTGLIDGFPLVWSQNIKDVGGCSPPIRN
jgi:hypothetical protein